MASSRYTHMFLSAASLLAAFLWCLLLTGTDSYYIVYPTVAAAGVVCCLSNQKYPVLPDKPRERVVTELLALLAAQAAVLANYRLFPLSAGIGSLSRAAAVLVSGWFLLRGILLAIYRFARQRRGAEAVTSANDRGWIFWGSLALLMTVYCFFLWEALYPGVLSTDSINQMEQIEAGRYTNNHPYYHTQMIHVLTRPGLWRFHDINAGVAGYSLSSIFLVSFVFSCVVYTLYQYTHRKSIAAVALAFYVLMPYHITYSVTMWKDIPFSASVTLFIVGTFRVLKGLGKHPKWNAIASAAGALGICLLRSNVQIAFALGMLLLGPVFFRDHKKLMGLLVGVALAGFVLAGPLLTVLHVEKAELVESLSIPAQQIGRVLADGGTLTQDEYAALELVTLPEKIPEQYKNWIADPMKNLIRERGGQPYLGAHLWDYLKVYLSIGRRYPAEYLKAWIDETRGFWNGGYYNITWYTHIFYNEMGIVRTVRSPQVLEFLESYCKAFENVSVLQLFLCIGLFVWITVFTTYCAWIRQDRACLFTCIPVLAVILILLFITPVFGEFRYAYPMFCSIPFLTGVCFSPNGKAKNGHVAE